MDEHGHHEELTQSVTKEYQEILANSEQGVYIYLDDLHKVCNGKFAELLGYESEEQWAEMDGSFPDLFVADESQEALVSAFIEAMEKNTGSTNEIVWKKKDGSTVNSTVVLVPISYEGHIFALHFVTPL